MSKRPLKKPNLTKHIEKYFPPNRPKELKSPLHLLSKTPRHQDEDNFDEIVAWLNKDGDLDRYKYKPPKIYLSPPDSPEPSYPKNPITDFTPPPSPPPRIVMKEKKKKVEEPHPPIDWYRFSGLAKDNPNKDDNEFTFIDCKRARDDVADDLDECAQFLTKTVFERWPIPKKEWLICRDAFDQMKFIKEDLDECINNNHAFNRAIWNHTWHVFTSHRNYIYDTLEDFEPKIPSGQLTTNVNPRLPPNVQQFPDVRWQSWIYIRC